MSAADFDRTIERYHQALDRFQVGDPEPVLKFFSSQDDVTLANPFGTAARGRNQVADTARLAATHYRDGHATAFETVSKYVGTDMAYVLEWERYMTKVDGGNETVPIVLRVTSIFRVEDRAWKLVHRHADQTR